MTEKRKPFDGNAYNQFIALRAKGSPKGKDNPMARKKVASPLKIKKMNKALEEAVQYVLKNKLSSSRSLKVNEKSLRKIWTETFNYVGEQLLRGRAVQVSGFATFTLRVEKAFLKKNTSKYMPIVQLHDNFVSSEYVRNSTKKSGVQNPTAGIRTVNLSMTQISISAGVPREAVQTSLKDLFRVLGIAIRRAEVTDKISLDCGILHIIFGYQTFVAKWTKEFLNEVDSKQAEITAGVESSDDTSIISASPEKKKEDSSKRTAIKLNTVSTVEDPAPKVEKEKKVKKKRKHKKKVEKRPASVATSVISFNMATSPSPKKGKNLHGDWKQQIKEKRARIDQEASEARKLRELNERVASLSKEETKEKFMARRRRAQQTMNDNLKMAGQTESRRKRAEQVLEMGNIFANRKIAHPTFSKVDFQNDLKNQIDAKNKAIANLKKSDFEKEDQFLRQIAKKNSDHKQDLYSKGLKNKNKQKRVLLNQMKDREDRDSLARSKSRAFNEIPLVLGHDEEIKKRSKEISKELQQDHLAEAERKRSKKVQENQDEKSREQAAIKYLNKKEKELHDKKLRKLREKKRLMKEIWDEQNTQKLKFQTALMSEA